MPPSEETAHTPSSDKRFVAKLIELLDSPRMPVSERPTATPGHYRVVRRALALVEGSLEERDLSVPWLADSVGVAERTLYQAFSDEVGTSPYNYILVRRLNRFRRLLLLPEHRSNSCLPILARHGKGRATFTALRGSRSWRRCVLRV